MKRDINSNGYIFLYATILIVVVAVLLTATALWLQPFQDRNKKNEKRINILKAAGITDVNAKNAAWLFEKHCTSSFLLDEHGNPTEDEDLPVFVIDRQISVIPMQGSGLWGAIWATLPLLLMEKQWLVSLSTTSQRPRGWVARLPRRSFKANLLANRLWKTGI